MSHKIKKLIEIYLLAGFVLFAYGCTGGDPSYDKERDPEEEYTQLNLYGGCGHDAATDDIELSRAVLEDIKGSGPLVLKWEGVAIDSDKTRDLSLFLSDGEKPISGRVTPEDDAESAYSGVAITPEKGDPYHAEFRSVNYYSSKDLERVVHCYAVAGKTTIETDHASGEHICHMEMPLHFSQSNSQDPSFLRNNTYMYAIAEYREQRTNLRFNLIPATFRFIVTNATAHDISLQELSISLSDEGTPVASQSANLTFDWSNAAVDISLSEAGYDKVSVVTSNETSLPIGSDYVAYSMALPRPSDTAFKGKCIRFNIKSDNQEQVALELNDSELAEVNGSATYNWMGGKSYTVRITRHEDGKATGEILEGNRIEVSPSEPGIYTLCYEDEDSKPLAAYAPICTLTVKDLAYYEDFIDDNIAPREAHKIGIYNSVNERQGTIKILTLRPDFSESPIYRFGVLSDVHIGRDEITPEVDFERALKLFNSTGVAHTCICGDLTQNGKEAEFASFKDVASLSNAPIYATSGNHDATTSGITPERWTQYTGVPLVYERTVEVGGKADHFLFLGMERWNFSAAYYDYHISWLESKLEEYRNERCFIFTHLFFPDRAGNLNDIYPSGNWLKGEQLEKLEAMCERYLNAMWFSGHSHWEWCLQKYQDRANIFRTYSGSLPTSGWCVHIPSCGVPRTSDGSSRSDVKAGSEAAIVEVYKDHIDIRGVEMISGKFLPIATYRLDTSLQSVAADNLTRRNYYISASDFVVNQSKKGATVSDVEGMPNYVDVTFTDIGQGFYVANNTFFAEATKVSITVEDVKAFSDGVAIDVPANVGFYGGSYYMTSTNSATIVNNSSYQGVQFQTSKSKYGDGPLPLTLRMKVMMSFY